MTRIQNILLDYGLCHECLKDDYSVIYISYKSVGWMTRELNGWLNFGMDDSQLS